jgi:hypothetical protein
MPARTRRRGTAHRSAVALAALLCTAPLTAHALALEIGAMGGGTCSTLRGLHAGKRTVR